MSENDYTDSSYPHLCKDNPNALLSGDKAPAICTLLIHRDKPSGKGISDVLASFDFHDENNDKDEEGALE